ncbi:hypothetical protein SERLA73DRAFT_154003 [Serpula lacrymans var. lacrymans S7.3]|uniref:DUF6589 domain-containing protein n=1 Tax=Serpula lacrymans var. lacrymans (strain S7.3) TaxID=936435 RepID=F8Q3D1_SERL3|nr:hypothetical protein SERLA73DRAFT_154003 [Serpula lacrymans var. lacrymans S7.3]
MPVWCKCFKSQLEEPSVLEQIPLINAPIVAARAMDVNNSTISGKIYAVVNLMAQGGVKELVEDTNLDHVDVSEHIVLFHGDLGTGEQLQAIQEQRSIEETPWNHFQYLISVPGLFHLKMACADTLWCTFLQLATARQDETSLMHNVSMLQPRETGIYGSKPGFRHMHQLVNHPGIYHCLDCWRVEVKTCNPAHSTLALFATSAPSFEELKAIAIHLAKACYDTQFLDL